MTGIAHFVPVADMGYAGLKPDAAGFEEIGGVRWIFLHGLIGEFQGVVVIALQFLGAGFIAELIALPRLGHQRHKRQEKEDG
jgi:hypothetical protein